MGIFSDMELGQIILVVVVIGLAVFFGGKNMFNDNSGSGKGGKSGGSTGGSTGSNDGGTAS